MAAMCVFVYRWRFSDYRNNAPGTLLPGMLLFLSNVPALPLGLLLVWPGVMYVRKTFGLPPGL